MRQYHIMRNMNCFDFICRALKYYSIMLNPFSIIFIRQWIILIYRQVLSHVSDYGSYVAVSSVLGHVNHFCYGVVVFSKNETSFLFSNGLEHPAAYPCQGSL